MAVDPDPFIGWRAPAPQTNLHDLPLTLGQREHLTKALTGETDPVELGPDGKVKALTPGLKAALDATLARADAAAKKRDDRAASQLSKVIHGLFDRLEASERKIKRLEAIIEKTAPKTMTAAATDLERRLDEIAGLVQPNDEA